MVVIMIITSTQTDRQSISRVCSSMNLNSRNGPRGIAAHHTQHIRPHGNFMLSDAPVCLTVKVRSDIRFGFSQHVAKTDFLPEKTQEPKGFIYDDCWWLSLNPFPLIAMVKMFAVSLVARWRTAAFSQFCLQIALPYKKGNRKLIVPWPSFNTHCTTNNACACQSCDSRTVCTSWKYHDPLTVYITASEAALLSLTTICNSSRIYVLLCLLA